jgi:DNA-binding MarR family transcriptional regulator
VKKDLIFRAQNPNDKRSNLIYLTAKGKGLQDTLLEIVKQTVAGAVDGIDPEDLNKCMKVLHLITVNTNINR